MKVKYVYNGTEYVSTYQLRKAIWENEHKVIRIPKEDLVNAWKALGVDYVEVQPTEAELAAQQLAEAKRLRSAQVANIKVEVNGKTFDGDEAAQRRMTSALKVAEITGMESTQWVLADNTVATVTVAEMQEALSKAMLAMGELWTVPYEEKVTEDAAS